ncbi:hypothetical protein Tco_0106794, partial [Tanacetum coccineum]
TLCGSPSANNSACMSLISRLMSLMTRRVSTICANGQSLEALLTQPAASESESHVPNAVSE